MPAPGDDGLALLTGPDAEDLLRAATRGEELVSWRVRSVDHRPGRGTAASYVVHVRSATGAEQRTFGASTGLPAPDVLPEGALAVPHRARAVTVWRWPADPNLPGLALATDPRGVRALLTSCAVPPGPVRLRVRRYRPRRRAVVEVHAAGRRLFLKVLRPPSAEATHRRHRLLLDAGVPVPRSLAWSDDGLVVLEALPGTTLRARLTTSSRPVPDAEALLALLDRLPGAVLALPRRRSWADEVAHYAAIVADALPAEAQRCRQLAERISAATAAAPGDEPAHGDFYESQLLLEGRRVTGLLDVDTAGPGRRADDLGCLLAHAAVLAQLAPERRERIERAAAGWLGGFERHVDPADLRARVAGVAVSLATGPHRVQEPGWAAATRGRLDLAERWLDGAAPLALRET